MTRFEAFWLLIPKPALRVRLSQRVTRYLRILRYVSVTLTDSREAVMLPLGVAFWAVFVILSALGCCAR